MSTPECLTSQQILAAQVLVLDQSQSVAAQRAGVTEMTICRWLRNPLFKQKLEEFQKEIQDIESNYLEEVAQKAGKNIRENVKKVLTPDELKAMLSEMVQDLELSPALRLKAAAQLGKWIGMESPKLVAADGRDDFPIQGLEGMVDDLKSLSDEELERLYIQTLVNSYPHSQTHL